MRFPYAAAARVKNVELFANKLNARPISSASLLIERTNSPKCKVPKEELTFGTTMTDHMLQIEWDIEHKWGRPKIIPYAPLQIDPAASVLHYGLECFEGMKAYKHSEPQRNKSDERATHIPNEDNVDEIRLFRPDCNMERMKNSMERLHFPCYDFDPNELIECIKELVRVDRDWVPDGEGYSLYLRPTCIATNPFLGLASPQKALLYCIASPVGPYYKSGFSPVRLTADTSFIRAWPGGTGSSKVGGNYGPTMKAAAEAEAAGYNQVLWLFGPEKHITEVGAMNVFFVLKDGDNDGSVEIVTPPLSRGDILPGVTRRSIVDLANSWDGVKMSEREVTMAEICNAADAGNLLEAFGAGTAAVVSPISCIQYDGVDIDIHATGAITRRVWNDLTNIQYGKVNGPDGWSVII